MFDKRLTVLLEVPTSLSLQSTNFHQKVLRQILTVKGTCILITDNIVVPQHHFLHQTVIHAFTHLTTTRIRGRDTLMEAILVKDLCVLLLGLTSPLIFSSVVLGIRLSQGLLLKLVSKCLNFISTTISFFSVN